MASSSTSSMPVILKWNKEVHQFQITIISSSFTGRDLKEQISALTHVPIERQKVMLNSKGKVKGLWKGILKDDQDLSNIQSQQQPLLLTMLGSAEVLQEPKQSETTKTIFIEDLTPQQQQQLEKQELQDPLQNVIGMIPAVQVLPQYRHDYDRHKPTDQEYPYNRLVHGLPQYQIEHLLQQQQQNSNNNKIQLTGRVVMTMGLELQRAYVNDLAVLQDDGTLVSGLQDGHIHLWKHGQRIKDVIHQPNSNSNSNNGVESVLALQLHNNTIMEEDAPAFATAGRGNVQLWTKEAESILTLPSTPFPYASPTGLVQLHFPPSNNRKFVLGLAAHFHITPPPATTTNRMVPQDEAGRQRLAYIQAQEAIVEQTMTQLRKSIQIWYYCNSNDENDTEVSENNTQHQPVLQSTVLQAATPVTALECWNTDSYTILAAGDAQGGIQFWKITMDRQRQQQVQVTQLQHYQFVVKDAGSSDNQYATTTHSAIECIKFIPNTEAGASQLIVSTRAITATSITITSDVASIPIQVSEPQAVHVLNVENDILSTSALCITLKGHKDVVSCVLPLPNGDLITAGGKYDATMKVWSHSQLTRTPSSSSSSQGADTLVHPSSPVILTKAESKNLCQDVGYVFALTVLEDFKASNNKNERQNNFAIAAARYNVIKVIL